MPKKPQWKVLSSNKPIAAKRFLIGVTNENFADVGSAKNLQNSCIVGATEGSWASVGPAETIRESLVIGATEREEAIVGFAKGDIQNSLILGATKGERANVGFAKGDIQNSLILGTTDAWWAKVGHAQGDIQNSLILGATNNREGTVGHAENIQNSVIIGSTDGLMASVGVANNSIQNSVIIGSANGPMSRVGDGLKEVQGSLIVSMTSERNDPHYFRPNIRNTLTINLRLKEAEAYDGEGKRHVIELSDEDKETLYRIRERFTDKIFFLGGIRATPPFLLGETSRFTQKLRTGKLAINLDEWYKGMVTDWEGKGVPILNQDYIEKSIELPAENLWRTKDVSFRENKLYTPHGTIREYLQHLAIYPQLDELLKLGSIAPYVPQPVHALLGATLGVNLGWKG